MPKEILDDPTPNNSRDDFWDNISKQEDASFRKLEAMKIEKLNKEKISHLNVCKRALYVALLALARDDWSDSNANIGRALLGDPYIQSILDCHENEII